MNAQLTEMCDRFRRNAERAQTIAASAGESRFRARPTWDSWSAAECLAHLALSTEMFLPGWSTALEEARARGRTGHGPFEMDWVGSAFTWALEPPATLRAKAPAILQPATTSGALDHFLASQEQLVAVIADSAGIALDCVMIASPVASWIRYNLWASLCVADAHQRRHLVQAARAAGVSDGLSE